MLDITHNYSESFCYPGARLLAHDDANIRLGLLSVFNKNAIAQVTVLECLGDSSFLDGVRLFGRVYVGHGCTIRDFVTIRDAMLRNDVIVEKGAAIETGALLCDGCLIGDYAIIGAHATIAPGVKIGRGSVIGANVIVSSDVPAGSIIPPRQVH